jgi:hypothetical protein
LGLAGALAAQHLAVRAAARSLITAGVLVGCAGTAMALAAPQLSYALTLQAQPYRYVWPLYLLAIPIGLEIVRRAWRGNSIWQTLIAVVLVSYLLLAGEPSWRAVAWLGCLAALLGKVITGTIDRRTTSAVLFVGMLAAALLHIQRFAPAVYHSAQGGHFLRGANLWFQGLRIAAGPAASVLLTIIVLVGCARLVRSRRAFGWACGGLFVGVQLIALGITQVSWCGAFGPARFREVAFVRETISGLAEPGQVPTVHWPNISTGELWFDVGANSYFSLHQIAGQLFHRETAIEAQRRSRLVAAFDLDYLSTEYGLTVRQPWLREIYGVQGELPPATHDGLFRLCGEPNLDFVVVPVEFPGLASATDGKWYVYDCRRIRQMRTRVPNLPVAVKMR